MEVTSTLLAPGAGVRPTPPASSLAGLTVEEPAAAPVSASAAAEPGTSMAGSPRPLASIAAGRGEPVRAARRHGGLTRTTASATSDPASPTPASRSTSVPITFDQQNPYK